MNSIPLKGQVIIVSETINYHNGSELNRIPIKKVHPDNIKMFLKINKLLGVELSGIDYMSPSIEKSYKQEGHIIEVNNSPDMKIHFKADSKNNNFAVRRFVKKLFN